MSPKNALIFALIVSSQWSPAARFVDPTEIVAEILHLELFDFGHAEHSWRACPLP